MKIFYFGKRITGLAEWKHKAKIKARKTIKLLAIVTIAVSAGYIYGNVSQSVTFAQKEVVEVDNLTPKVEELKAELLADLKQCESQGHTEDDAIIIIDTNGKLSYGPYMYQRATVVHYAKTLLGQDLTGKQAVELALDEKRAGELALKIMFESGNKANDWWNCQVKHNLTARIEIIKQLEK